MALIRPRALVTGIHGFTGKYVARELEHRAFEVFGTSHRHEPESARVHKVDLTKLAEVESFIDFVKPTVVVHLAAVSFVGHSDVSEIYGVNVVGTRNLLFALSKMPRRPDSVVLASSANIYGNSSEIRISEGTTPAPTNDYAVSKLAMEYMAHNWLSLLPITIVRPFNYTGRGQSKSFLVPKLVDHFKEKSASVELGNLDVFRDYSDVRTVAWVYAGLALDPSPGNIFNVASGKSTSLMNLIECLESMTGHSIDVVTSPDFVRSGEIRTLCGDATKIRNHLGEIPSYELNETLAWMLED